MDTQPKPRKKIHVKRLFLTEEQLQRARKKALEDFKKLLVWKDSRPLNNQD